MQVGPFVTELLMTCVATLTSFASGLIGSFWLFFLFTYITTICTTA